jgi:Arc/MetJ-type ribon-helix-helix transcriptional regulator
MRVELTPDQEAFLRQAIKDGRAASAEDAVQEALQLWENANAVEPKLLPPWMKRRWHSAAVKEWQ